MKSNNIQVALRKRPLLQREIEKGNGAQVVEVVNNKQINLLDPDEINKNYNLNYNINKNRFKETHFTFDFVYDEDATNLQVYKEVGQLYLSDVIEGFNSTIFAYGATAAGKTYTMVGQKDVPGLMDMAVEGLFERIRSKEVTHDVTVKVAYMEIYNENLKDLLSNDQKNLDLREDPKSDVTQVHGLTEVDVTDPQQISEFLRIGSRNRSKDSTISNEASSRSHAILQISVECMDKAEGLEKEIINSKLSLVDLAGSERSWANKSKANKIEGAKINQSLLTLGNCISALSEISDKGPSKNSFIPYRGSKLTRLLKDSLGGNCRTVMIANISGSILSFEDTYNTLQYSSRAKNIKVHVQKNIVSTSNHVSNYASIIEKLNKENENLRNILQSNGNNKNGAITKLPQINPIAFSQQQSTQNQSQQQQDKQQLTEGEQLLQEQLEQQIKQQFDDEVGYIRTIQEVQMKIDKIGRMNFQLQAEINRLNPNDQTQLQYKEQQQINNQGVQSLYQQIQELNSRLKQLQDNRKVIISKIKQSILPPKNQLYLNNLLSAGEMYAQKVEKQFNVNKQHDRIREKEIEINELQEQLNIRDKILLQQKSLIKQNNLQQQSQQHQQLNNSLYGKLKDASIIMSSINATSVQTPINHTQSQQINSVHHIEIDSPLIGSSRAGKKRVNKHLNLSVQGNVIQANLSPAMQIKQQLLRISKERNLNKSFEKYRNVPNLNDIRLLNVPKSTKKLKRNLPSAKSQARISHSPAGSHQGKKRPSYLVNKTIQNDQIHSSISPPFAIAQRKKFNYSLMDENSTANISYSDTNLSPKSRVPPPNYYSNLVNKYQNHIYTSINNLDSFDTQSRKSNQTPKAQQRMGGANISKSQSQRNLPMLQLRKNVVDYDVHKSPYVQSFENPENAAFSRKSKLQQLNLNLDNLKDLYTQKYYNI